MSRARPGVESWLPLDRSAASFSFSEMLQEEPLLPTHLLHQSFLLSTADFLLPTFYYRLSTFDFLLPAMRRVFRLFTNKYLLATVAFAVWMIFFDQNDVASIRARKKKLAETEAAIQRMEAEAAAMDAEAKSRQTDPRALETFARERYRMKRDGEDLYVIDEQLPAPDQP